MSKNSTVDSLTLFAKVGNGETLTSLRKVHPQTAPLAPPALLACGRCPLLRMLRMMSKSHDPHGWLWLE